MGPRFRGEEIGSQKRRPMRAQECPPRHRTFAAGRDAGRPSNACNGRTADLMPDISSKRLECACIPTSDSRWPSGPPARGCGLAALEACRVRRCTSTCARRVRGASAGGCPASRSWRRRPARGGPRRWPSSARRRRSESSRRRRRPASCAFRTRFFPQECHHVLLLALKPAAQHRHHEVERKHR